MKTHDGPDVLLERIRVEEQVLRIAVENGIEQIRILWSPVDIENTWQTGELARRLFESESA